MGTERRRWRRGDERERGRVEEVMQKVRCALVCMSGRAEGGAAGVRWGHGGGEEEAELRLESGSQHQRLQATTSRRHGDVCEDVVRPGVGGWRRDEDGDDVDSHTGARVRRGGDMAMCASGWCARVGCVTGACDVRTLKEEGRMCQWMRRRRVCPVQRAYEGN